MYIAGFRQVSSVYGAVKIVTTYYLFLLLLTALYLGCGYGVKLWYASASGDNPCHLILVSKSVHNEIPGPRSHTVTDTLAPTLSNANVLKPRADIYGSPERPSNFHFSILLNGALIRTFTES